MNVDIGKFSDNAKSKLSGYTCMKLNDLQDEQVVHLLIRTNKDDATIFKEQIELTNFKFIFSFDSKVTLRGIAKNIPLLANLDFVEYIEIGGGLAPEKR